MKTLLLCLLTGVPLARAETVQYSPCTISVMPNTMYWPGSRDGVLATTLRVLREKGSPAVCCDLLYKEKEYPHESLAISYGGKVGSFPVKVLSSHDDSLGEEIGFLEAPIPGSVTKLMGRFYIMVSCSEP